MADKVSFRWEKLEALLNETNCRDMIVAYWQELSPIKSVAKLDPDWPAMIERERAGLFCVWAARVNGVFAGFVSFHLFPHLNYRSTLFAIDAGHFLSPAFRDKGRLGFRMWRTAERALKARGAKVIMAHDNAKRPLMPFFLALGYEPRSVIFWKAL